jgi:flagellar hook assembly protein FlgD
MVQIVIYNIQGQRVVTLLDERRPAGIHAVMWDGRDGAGEPVATGVYFVQMRSGSFKETKKIVLLK